MNDSKIDKKSLMVRFDIADACMKLATAYDRITDKMSDSSVLEFVWLITPEIYETYFKHWEFGMNWEREYRGRKLVTVVDGTPVLLADRWPIEGQAILLCRYKFSTDILEPCGSQMFKLPYKCLRSNKE